ncbi:MAG: EAL domain-containing protein [Proteobacteria bacterium]|nr:EAL domain-containing protein [Pseudomonadota bacterium]
MAQNPTTPTPEPDAAAQRARLVAFAFARADLLLEIDRTATITFASGAARWAVDRAAGELIGVKFPTLAAAESAGVLRDLQKAFTQGTRFPPQTLLFKRGSGEAIAASLAGCPMPDMPDRYFLTIAHPYKRTSDLHSGAVARSDESGLLTRESFEKHARAQLEAARQSGEELEMTMLDLAELTKFKEGMSEEKADTFMRGVGLILKKQSAGGDAAGQIDATKFSVLHTRDVAKEDIEQEISSFAKRMDSKGSGMSVLARTLDLDAALLEGEDAGRALVFAINQFASAEPGEFSVTKLSEGLKELVKETVKRVSDFRETLAARGFTLHFQPIVDLRTREVQHQEALTRLPDGRSPFQMVTFVEQIGLVSELDHAVCRQALDLLRQDSTLVDIAINISGRSLQSELFVAAHRVEPDREPRCGRRRGAPVPGRPPQGLPRRFRLGLGDPALSARAPRRHRQGRRAVREGPGEQPARRRHGALDRLDVPRARHADRCRVRRGRKAGHRAQRVQDHEGPGLPVRQAATDALRFQERGRRPDQSQQPHRPMGRVALS